MADYADRIISSRRDLCSSRGMLRKQEEEGGCGVVGFACNVPVSGRHIFAPSLQMHNRGNGKGGGIAAVGFDPERLGVSREILEQDYLLQVAYLKPEVREEVEREIVRCSYTVEHEGWTPTIDDYRDIGLESEPPAVYRYFVRAEGKALKAFAKQRGLEDLPGRTLEDEFVYQTSYRLNKQYYASLGEKAAFVLSHGRNMFILKIVGYAEQVAQYYKLEDFSAHLWIAHQRYPTKGRVWHPGGAHPFIGLHEALVHNGDFANYRAVSDYLRQRNIEPLFLTDTEVSILLFDLLYRVYGYPLEYVIEALAPTTELDFDLLPEAKQDIYRRIQASHVAGSPDGPWFFIIARNDPGENQFQLIGITDTAMLRPQVFALQDGPVQIGLIASEKQAIDATLQSLAGEDERFGPIADRYWNARGGSHTDGGAFMFTVKNDGESTELVCTDKFGRAIEVPHAEHCRLNTVEPNPVDDGHLGYLLGESPGEDTAGGLFRLAAENLANWSFENLSWFCKEIENYAARSDDHKEIAIELLTLLNDRKYSVGQKKSACVLEWVRGTLEGILLDSPKITDAKTSRFCLIDRETADCLREPGKCQEILVINAQGFAPEGEQSDAALLVRAVQMGWKRFMGFGYTGQRFLGCGLGPETKGVRIDAYGSSGDYLASGIDGLEMHVHGNAQDQLGQILKSGKLVIHGDVGQTFMYGAKGGEVYVLGNAAGRPLINAVGRPRVVINGTCLDFLAESFMAGDPFKGGGFVILNGVYPDEQGQLQELATPYPGSNLFSMASGGAIYVRDPHGKLVAEQLNGGEFADVTEQDWELILPYLQENERLFGIGVEELLRVYGVSRPFEQVYRKVRAVRLSVLVSMIEDSED